MAIHKDLIRLYYPILFGFYMDDIVDITLDTHNIHCAELEQNQLIAIMPSEVIIPLSEIEQDASNIAMGCFT